jgi:hypothetical protein
MPVFCSAQPHRPKTTTGNAFNVLSRIARRDSEVAAFCATARVIRPSRNVNHSGESKTQKSKTPLESGVLNPAEAGETLCLVNQRFPQFRSPVKRKCCFR